MKNDNEKNKTINAFKKDLNLDVERLDIENVELNLKVEDIKTTPSSESDNLNRVNNVSEKENVDDTSFDNEINDDNFDSDEESEKIDDDFDSEEEQEELDDDFDSDEELEQLDDDFDSIEEPEQYDDEFNDKEDNNTNQEEKNEKPNEESAEQKNNENNSNSENKDNEEHKNENQDNKNEKPSEQEKKSNDSKDRPDANENVKKDSPNKPEQKQPESPSKDMSNNIKNKANSAKDRMSKQTNPAQNLKKNSGNGKSPLKDKLAKKHNNSSAASNGAKKAGDAAANGAKKAGQAAANGAKKAGQAAAKGAQAAGKAAAGAAKSLISLFIKTLPYSAIVLGIILIIILAIVLVMYFIPGTTGFGDNGNNYSKFSEKDQETMKELEELFSRYPEVDGSLAMSVVLYPYFSILHSGTVEQYLISDNEITETEDEEEVTEETEETEEEPGDAEIDDDVYLYPLRMKKVRDRLDDVLIELNRLDEDEFKAYLKDTYFKKDNGYVIGYDKEITDGYKGYKTMLNNINSADEEAFKDALIKDIFDNKTLFISYVYRHYTCTTNLQSAGTVEIEEMLKSNILVDVKVPSCKSGSGVWDCESVYDSPISLKQYVFGGTYEEFNSMDVEKTAAQMLAIKSYVVQRGKNMGWGVKEDDAGNYVVTIRNNTNDLVYCDTDLGCKSGKTEVGSGNTKRDPISDAQKQVYEDAWNKVFDKYIFDKESNKTVGAFCQSRSGDCDFCKKGTCLSHDELSGYSNTSYDSIIGIQYSSYAMIQVEGDFANVTVAGAADCSGKGSYDIDDSNFVYYAQTDYPNSSFCQRKLVKPSSDGNCANGSSICSSGCGLVSMTMVSATLTQNYSINPVELNSYMKYNVHCGDYGTSSWGMFPYVSQLYGLTYQRIPFSNDAIGDMKKALDDGGLIIAAVCGGFKANKTYTNGCGGHFLVVRGYDGDSVYISDPYQNYNLKTYADCVYKVDDKCVKHKMNFNTFYNDLKAKESHDGGDGAFWVFKGNTAFQELK